MRHRVQNLTPLTGGDQVYIPQMKTTATVQKEFGERSYIVSKPKGQVRRNRRHLILLPKETVTEVSPSPSQSALEAEAEAVAPVPSDHGNVSTRSGRVVRPLQRLIAE